ncbi:MAG: efflux RND transporter permease subunit [Candidatus Saccharicenans sp.]|nr:efflux RND transporter permease subunit [Candidatus Saccharicenans sp.]
MASKQSEHSGYSELDKKFERSKTGLFLGDFSRQHSSLIIFLAIALCLAGIYAATNLASSVFPQTNFPRVVILIDNGVMPAEEMMASITRPIEEAMKDIPGSLNIRSTTGRGSAEISVYFTWSADMIQSELYVMGRLSEIKSSLPPAAVTTVYRLTFSAFPILGVSLISPKRDITELWEIARYELKPRFIRIPGVARVNLVGGRTPEFQVVVDPVRLQAAGLTLDQITGALEKNNLVTSTGMHEENYFLYLTVVDGRLHSLDDISSLVVAVVNGHPLAIKDVARVERGPAPVFNVVTAEGVKAVLLNIYSQPDGSTLQIAKELRRELADLKQQLPPDMKLAFFYDQSEIVSASVGSVWEAIIFGLILSMFIMFLFLRNWRTTFLTIIAIPVTVLVTLAAMELSGLTFNLMTLGGIAAAIGLIIDDAIVVAEAIHTKISFMPDKERAIRESIGEIFKPLVGSTLTPVVVFIPLAFLSGITGVFFRALAITMSVALVTSLVVAMTLTPSLAGLIIPERKRKAAEGGEEGREGESGGGSEGGGEAGGDAESPGEIRAEETEEAEEAFSERGGFLPALIKIYEAGVRAAIKHYKILLAGCLLIIALGVLIYRHLQSEFLPPMDEGGFVIDYFTPPGTSLAETDRELRQAEDILKTVPEVESYSRRTGARLALSIAEPNTGDFLVKLKPKRPRKTAEVIAELRQRFNAALPTINWEFPGILSDLIGDLMWAPQPIEIKIFSTDVNFLKAMAPAVEEKIKQVPGVVDTFNGLVYTGSALSLKLKPVEAQRFGLTASDIGGAVETAMLGSTASYVLQGDRIVDVRVKVDPGYLQTMEMLRNLPLRTPANQLIQLSQVVDLKEESGQLEIRREDLRQDVAVTARLEGRDMGSAMADIKKLLSQDKTIPAGTIEYGGLYEQQQESFRNLLVVMFMAIVLVFTVLLAEFKNFLQPLSIVLGAVLAMFGTVLALWLTGTSLNVVSILGAIIGIGLVAKNGILMMDYTNHLQARGVPLGEALVRSGRRRLRPVLMTTLAAALGLLPLAYGIGSGADMLKPLAIAVIGALLISVLLSLIATPTFYYLFKKGT